MVHKRLKSLMFLMLLVGANAQTQGQETTAPTTPKPVNLDFNELGVATVDLKDIVVTGNTPENVIWDPSTGKITSKGGDWSLTLYLDNERFANVTTVKIETEIPQNDVISCISIFPSDSQTRVGGGWYSSKYNFDYSSVWTNDTNIPQRTYQELGPVVDRFVIETNGQVGEMTIKSITITKTLLRGGKEISLLSDDFKRWTASSADGTATNERPNFEFNINQEKTGGATIYGDGNVDCLNYAELSNYDILNVKITPGAQLRVLLNRKTAAQDQIELNPVANEDGLATVDLTQYDYVHLNAIKLSWGSPAATLEDVTVSKNGVDYIFKGAGDLTSEGKTLLADENATLIDATGVTKATDQIKFANPNCLYIANEGILTNENNVLIADGNGGYTCENLVLDVTKPFRIPGKITTTNASAKKSVSKAGYATMVLPFEVEVPEGVTAYKLTSVDGDKIMGETLTTIPAGQPVLLKANATDYTFTATNATLTTNQQPDGEGLLTGVYADGYAPAGSYVLQNNTEGVAFYTVEKDNAQRVLQYTAYLTLPESAQQANRLIFDLGEDDVTGIESVEAAAESTATVVEIYDLSGRQVSAPVKGINLMKMSDGSVKKVIVK